MSWLEAGHGGLGWLATGLLHGSALALITWLLCRTVLLRARPALRSALWTVVLLKFLVPIGPELSVSMSGAIDGVFAGEAIAQASTYVTAETLVAGPRAASVAAPSGLDFVWALLFAAYLLVVLVLASRRVLRHVGARRRAAALPAVNPELAAILDKAAFYVGLRKVPRAVLGLQGVTPYLVGVTRPLLVVPQWMRRHPAELEAALIHELAHVRRRDTWLRGLQLVVGTLFFFWPVVALVSRRLDVSREMACDEWVVSRGDIEGRAYARLLVSLAAHRPGRSACASAALIGRRPQLEERVDHLLRRRSGLRAPGLGPAAGTALAGWTVLVLAGSAGAHGPSVELRAECVVDDQLIGQILASYPDADTDGNGELTRKEICAHHDRMKRQLVERAFDDLDPERVMSVAVRVDPAADTDGDGNISRLELEGVKDQLASSIDPRDFDLDPVAFPGRVCQESAASCTEGDGRDLQSGE